MVEPERRRADESDDVTVSEAAAYAFCAKAWHLEHVLWKAASPRAAQRRARGVRRHEQHGEAIAAQRPRSTRRRAFALIVLLLVVLVVIGLLLRGA